jgi:hypothetical protein
MVSCEGSSAAGPPVATMGAATRVARATKPALTVPRSTTASAARRYVRTTQSPAPPGETATAADCSRVRPAFLLASAALLAAVYFCFMSP